MYKVARRVREVAQMYEVAFKFHEEDNSSIKIYGSNFRRSLRDFLLQHLIGTASNFETLLVGWPIKKAAIACSKQIALRANKCECNLNQGINRTLIANTTISPLISFQF